MSTKHTPGPWKAERRYSNGCPTCPVVVGGDGRDLAEVYGAPQFSAVGWPNARLISAGPRMYEYILKRANTGDSDAAQIIADIGNE